MANDKIYLPTKDQQDQLLSLIGKTNDTGGSASAGTISAKLNKILQAIKGSYLNPQGTSITTTLLNISNESTLKLYDSANNLQSARVIGQIQNASGGINIRMVINQKIAKASKIFIICTDNINDPFSQIMFNTRTESGSNRLGQSFLPVKANSLIAIYSDATFSTDFNSINISTNYSLSYFEGAVKQISPMSPPLCFSNQVSHWS